MKQNSDTKTLILITGPTAVGKTQTSIEIARLLQTQIVSADARQFYRETRIGTAAPTQEELSQVNHHLVGHLSIHDPYNVSIFEQQALRALESIFSTQNFAVLTGGSGLYIDTLLDGIDWMPDIPHSIRQSVKEMHLQKGVEGLQNFLREYDPEYFKQVDIHNPNRMMRGIEVFLATGKKYSSLRTTQKTPRSFRVKRIIINRPRQELHQRIHLRTRAMVQQGIIEEAIQLFPYRHLNALNTVGYKELFDWMAHTWDLHTAIQKIETHTRRYAKRQITWFKRYEDAKWFLPTEVNAILRYINS